MRIKSYKVYKFSELSEKAKEKAIEKFRYNQDLSFTWETTQEDAKNIGLDLTGIERGDMRGYFENSAEDCIAKILKEHGKKCETYKTALQYKKELKNEKDEDKHDDIKEEFLRSILEDYRIMQEKDEEYQISEEEITETIEANDYEFTEEGDID